MNVRLVMVVLCSLLLCGQLPAQEIDVQYNGTISLFSVLIVTPTNILSQTLLISK